MDDSFNILNRQRELAMRAASDTTSDKERVALDVDYQNLITQVKDNAGFEYNGMSLLDGSYSGTTTLNTYQGEQVINVFDDISQFVATGSIGENGLVKSGSSIEAVKNMGKTAASKMINLSGIASGGTITVNGKHYLLLQTQSLLKIQNHSS